MGDFNGAIRVLRKHNRIVDALEYAKKYESENIPISECYRVNIMANQIAKELSKQPNSQEKLFETVIAYLAPIDQVNYLMTAGMYERACEVLKKEGKFKEVYKVYQAQGWHEEGIQLAKFQKDREDELHFILFKATKELEDGNKAVTNTTTTDMLKKKMGYITLSEIRTTLVYGMTMQNPSMTKGAFDHYKHNHNGIGLVEAFNQVISLASYSEISHEWKNIVLKRDEDLLTLTLHVCEEIRAISTALQRTDRHNTSPADNQVIKQVESFYGLEREMGEQVYRIPPSSYPWTNMLISPKLLNSTERDINGMLILDESFVFKAISDRLERFIEKWIVKDEFKLVENFAKAFDKFPFHQQIISGGYLTKSYLSHPDKTINLFEYVRLLCSALTIESYGNTHISDHFDVMKAVMSALSPQATCYMRISSLTALSPQMSKRLKEEASSVLGKSDSDFKFNEWLEAWRINCITRKGHKQMTDILCRRANTHNKSTDDKLFNRQRSNDLNRNVPLVYVLDRSMEYKHLMSLWQKTCELISAGKVFPSCTIAVHSIVRHIAANSSIWNTISISNLLNIVTIHATAILSLYAACSVYLRSTAGHDIYLPFSYTHSIEVFQHFTKSDIYRSCINDVYQRRLKGEDLYSLQNKLYNLLIIILKIMIGKQNDVFNPLKYAISRDACIQNQEAHHCLIFVLILFGNIGLMDICPDEKLKEYRLQMYNSVKHCDVPALKKAYERFATCATVVGCFGAAKLLLTSSSDDLHHLYFHVNARFNYIDVTFHQAQLMKIYQRRLLPIDDDLLIYRQSRPAEIRPSILRATAAPFYPSNNSEIGLLRQNTDEESFNHDEDDYEIIEALNEPTTLSEQVVPQEIIEDNSSVTKEFCSICACPLKEDTSDTPVDSDHTSPTENGQNHSETTYSHLRSEKHLTNTKLYERFNSEVTEYYSPRTKQLTEMLLQCESLYKDIRDYELQRFIENTKNELKQNEKEIQDVQYSAEWRKGISILENEIAGRLDSLLVKANSHIEKIQMKKSELEKAREEQDKKEEEEEEENQDWEEKEEKIADTDPNYGESDKSKKRKAKKRSRKNKK